MQLQSTGTYAGIFPRFALQGLLLEHEHLRSCSTYYIGDVFKLHLKIEISKCNLTLYIQLYTQSYVLLQDNRHIYRMLELKG